MPQIRPVSDLRNRFADVYFKLKKAEIQAKQTSQRFSHKEVFDDLKKTLQEKCRD